MFLMCTMLSHTMSDETFTRVLTNRIIGEGPKTWHQYVNEFLYKLLNVKNKTEKYQIDHMFYYFYQGVSYLFKLSEMELMKPNPPNYTRVVIRASGKLELVDIGIGVYFAYRKRSTLQVLDKRILPHISYLWKFEIDIKLRVLLKFIYIQFPLSPYDCVKGNLTISIDSRIPPKFCFCGQKAAFALYPPAYSVNIAISVMEDILYKVFMSFMVIDTGLLETQQGNYNLSENLYSVVLIMGKLSVTTYHFQVGKTQKIQLQVLRSMKSLVFDGPGYQSLITQSIYSKGDKLNKYFMTTSFQCLLQSMCYYKSYCSGEFVNYNAINIKLHDINLELDQLKNITVPIDFCKDSPCGLSVTVPSEEYVNATIINQTFEGTYTMDCIYGGISFIEKIENTDSELNSFCTPHNGGLSHSRRIFSKMATLIILTFWYKHYSQTSVQISLISTKCRAIQIDICKFHLSCLYNSRQSRCLEYIRPIFRAANVKFEYQNVQTFSNKVSQVLFLPQLNQCIIFQYTQDLKFNTIYENSDTDKYLSHCRLRLRVASIAKPGLKVNYIFLGSSKHRKNDKKWYINFKGLNDKFCYRLGIQGKLYCQSQICTKERCFSRANQFIPHELVSFFKVTSKTDTEFQIIENLVQMHKLSDQLVNCYKSTKPIVKLQ